MAISEIVNGCQTCYVLYDEQEHLGPDVYVAVRIIGTGDKVLVSRIVAATNRREQHDKGRTHGSRQDSS